MSPRINTVKRRSEWTLSAKEFACATKLQRLNKKNRRRSQKAKQLKVPRAKERPQPNLQLHRGPARMEMKIQISTTWSEKRSKKP